VSTVKATFTFEGDDNVSRIVQEILRAAEAYNHAKIMANDGKEFYINYSYEESFNDKVVGIGVGYIDSEECY
jgi:hypothetical protein